MTDMTYDLTASQPKSKAKPAQATARKGFLARMVDAIIELRMRQARRVVEQRLGRSFAPTLEPRDSTRGVNDAEKPDRS